MSAKLIKNDNRHWIVVTDFERTYFEIEDGRLTVRRCHLVYRGSLDNYCWINGRNVENFEEVLQEMVQIINELENGENKSMQRGSN